MTLASPFMAASLCKARIARGAYDYSANGYTHAAVVKVDPGKDALRPVAERLPGDAQLQRRSDSG
jgi:hypothetical protein